MLYIFLVNNGTMMTFEMNLALDTVENLKLSIYEQYQIPVSYQVLLISGGESLNLNDRVCKYSSAGTDTSPIFLFSKNQTDFPSPISFGSDSDLDDMKDRVESCFQMDSNFNTVVARTEMAIQLFETDKMLYHTCDKLVHDQHLQQQGWAAVVANLEDIVLSFKNKAKRVNILYCDILKNKNFYFELLQSFEEDKQILSRMPILNSLFPKNENCNNLTLLEWILRKNSQNSLDELYCMTELENFDKEKLDSLISDVDKTIKKCDNSDMKEIKGLEHRLFALEKLMVDAKKVFDKQGILAQGFTQNQTRFSDLRDPSILPDLCQNHKEQLQLMLKNHIDLVDLRSRCLMAKKELSQNLHQRLMWIVHIEEQLKLNDDLLVVYGLKLQKLRNKLEIIQNLHLAPDVYLKSIAEVLRRKTFSETFYTWAISISVISKQMIDNEIELRQVFSSQLDNHFLKMFFPGMNDLPQNFIQDLVKIDQSLPQITFEDVEFLKNELPEMSDHLVVLPSVPMPSLIGNQIIKEDEQQSTKSLNEYRDMSIATSLTAKDINQLESAKIDIQSCLAEKNQVIEQLVNKLNLSELKCNKQERIINCYQIINNKMIRLFRSVKGQLFDEINKQILNNSQDFNGHLQEVQASFEQVYSKFEEKTSSLLVQVAEKEKSLADLHDRLHLLENELEATNAAFAKLEMDHNETKQMVLNKVCKIEKLKENINKLNQDDKNKYQIIINLKTQLVDLKLELENKKNEFLNLIDDFKNSEIKMVEEEFTRKLSALKQRYDDDVVQVRNELTAEKDEEIVKLREQLSQKHKNEIDSLRHRFKLAISTTSIERTSSETSLEKVQLDIVDQSAQEKEIQRLSNSFVEQKLEYEETISKLKSDYENRIQILKAEFDKEQKLAMNESLKKFLIENELNADQLVHRIPLYEKLYSQLNSKLNIDIENSDLPKCQEILNHLSQDLSDINRNLDSLNSRSFISLPVTPESPKNNNNETDLSTSVVSKFNLQNLEIINPNSDEKISITSCEIGDHVLVYYEKKLENYIVFSLTENLHYIHSDSLKECEFSKDVSSNEFQWIIAQVMEKEYCQIKKEENRYRLPLNTKFYRIKIKPISKCNTNPINMDPSNQMNRSYMPSSSNRTILSNIMSFFGTSIDTPQNMSRSYNFE